MKTIFYFILSCTICIGMISCSTTTKDSETTVSDALDDLSKELEKVEEAPAEVAKPAYFISYSVADEITIHGDNNAGYSADKVSNELANNYGAGKNMTGKVTVTGLPSAMGETEDMQSLVGQEFDLSFEVGDHSSADSTVCIITSLEAGETNEYLGTEYKISATFSGSIVTSDGSNTAVSNGEIVLKSYK